ncbi:hypothetical protein J6590_049584 [Homalodisca vitripennis]|nr:hypothetical protein J6590_049582 [Homalodisca vitripennis]KAG8321276.1 hypothetical protein J6590_049584 [Homalodisca vitripennis]
MAKVRDWRGLRTRLQSRHRRFSISQSPLAYPRELKLYGSCKPYSRTIKSSIDKSSIRHEVATVAFPLATLLLTQLCPFDSFDEKKEFIGRRIVYGQNNESSDTEGR